MDDDIKNWWLKFEKKKPDETIIDTFESQVNLAIWMYIILIILLSIWGYIICPILVG